MENPLTLIEEEFGVTTVPGFSDVIGDPQPPWEDVTYLRSYFDHHPQARKYITPEQPPYFLQDIARLNHYPGEVPNQELWEYITNIIPYYREKFGIDGARIDMGHALPAALNRAIIAKARAGRADFILWSRVYRKTTWLQWYDLSPAICGSRIRRSRRRGSAVNSLRCYNHRSSL